jgi:hypothetical protein
MCFRVQHYSCVVSHWRSYRTKMGFCLLVVQSLLSTWTNLPQRNIFNFGVPFCHAKSWSFATGLSIHPGRLPTAGSGASLHLIPFYLIRWFHKFPLPLCWCKISMICYNTSFCFPNPWNPGWLWWSSPEDHPFLGDCVRVVVTKFGLVHCACWYVSPH